MRSSLAMLVVLALGAGCGVSSLPALGLHAATTRRVRLAEDGSSTSQHWELLLYADLAFQLGTRTPRDFEADPTTAADTSEPALAPPTAASECTFSTLCAWESAQVEGALARLDPGDGT